MILLNYEKKTNYAPTKLSHLLKYTKTNFKSHACKLFEFTYKMLSNHTTFILSNQVNGYFI
jgi:hypothetical protein